MSYFILIAILAVVLLDSKILRKYNLEVFEATFYFPRYWILAATLALLLIGFSSPAGLKAFPALVLLLVLPVYLTRKRRFVKESQFYENKEADGQIDLNVLLSDAYGVIITWFYIFLILSIINKVVFGGAKSNESSLGEIIFSSILSSAVLLILIAHASNRFSNKGFLYNAGFKGGRWSIHKAFLLPFFSGLVFAGISAYIALSRDITPVTPLSEIIDATKSSLAIFVFIILAIFIAPLVEEIIFRGYFYQVIKQLKGKFAAVMIISLSFAVLHVGQYWGDWIAIIMVTILGFTLTVLRATSGTTLTSTIAHYVYNGGVTVIPIIVMMLSNPAYFKYQTNYYYYDTATKEQLLNESIQKQPRLADAYNDLAWLYAEDNKNLTEALNLIDKALEMKKDNPVYLDTKVKVLYQLKRDDEAKAVHDRLLEIDPDYQSEGRTANNYSP
jgi:membrane protease YdiL (CAAX protease family)